jgi:pyruvate,water dikinase
VLFKAIMAEQFLHYFDGFAIGTNDLTQVTLRLERDAGMELLAKDFDEGDSSVKTMLPLAIKAFRAQGKYIGICSRSLSDYRDLAQRLVQEAKNVVLV